MYYLTIYYLQFMYYFDFGARRKDNRLICSSLTMAVEYIFSLCSLFF